MKNKFNAIRVSYSDRSFASKGERDCYQMFELMERAGEIDSIKCQVTTTLLPGLTHRTDFSYRDIQSNKTIWAEFKGFEDQRWRDIKKIWRFHGPGTLKVYKGSGLRICCVETIYPEQL